MKRLTKEQVKTVWMLVDIQVRNCKKAIETVDDQLPLSELMKKEVQIKRKFLKKISHIIS